MPVFHMFALGRHIPCSVLALVSPSSPLSLPPSASLPLGMVLVAYAGRMRTAAALRDSELCLLTDIHSSITFQ